MRPTGWRERGGVLAIWGGALLGFGLGGLLDGVAGPVAPGLADGAPSAVLALGSDWPVAAFDPWKIMADAQRRRHLAVEGSLAVGPDQALTATEALEGYTTHAHRAIASDGDAPEISRVNRPAASYSHTVWNPRGSLSKSRRPTRS